MICMTFLFRFCHWFWGIYYFWIRDMKSDWPAPPRLWNYFIKFRYFLNDGFPKREEEKISTVRFEIFSSLCILYEVFVCLSIFTKLYKSFPNFYPDVILCWLRWRKVFNFDWFFSLFCRHQIIEALKESKYQNLQIFKSFQLLRQIRISGKICFPRLSEIFAAWSSSSAAGIDEASQKFPARPVWAHRKVHICLRNYTLHICPSHIAHLPSKLLQYRVHICL